jgi:O-antigen ligase
MRIQPRVMQAAQWALVAGFLLFPVAFAMGNVFIAVAFVLSLAAGAYRTRWQSVRQIPAVWWALGLYAVVLVGLAYSPAPWADARVPLSKYGKLLALPVLLSLLMEPLWRRRCFGAFMLGMGFILASVYANVFWLLPWSTTQNLGWGQDHTVIGDYITQNVMMAFFVIASLSQAQRAVDRRIRMGWWFVALAAGVAVTQLSEGRTGYLLLIVAVATYVFFALKGRLRWGVLAGLIVAIALALATSTTVRERVELGVHEAMGSDSMATLTSIGGRVNFWRKTLEFIGEKPALGWGTGNYHGTWCARVTEPGWCWFGGWHPHNQYLFFWMENGLPGLLFYLLLVSSTAWAARRAEPVDRPLLWGFAAIFVVNSLINSPLFSGRESHFFVMLLVLLSAQARWGSGSPQSPALR